jgi:hypothetical protein
MEDLGTDNRTILNLLLRNLNGNLGTGFIWNEINTFFRLFWKHNNTGVPLLSAENYLVA